MSDPFAEGKARASRRANGRLATAFVLSLLFHAILIVLSGTMDEPRAETVEDELLVPLELEASAEPPPTLDQAEPVDEPPSPEETPAEEIPPDESLLGFASQGEIEADPDRPVGPESEFPGLPPGSQGEPEPADDPSDDPVEEPPDPAPDSNDEPEPEPADPLDDPPIEPAVETSEESASETQVEPEALDEGDAPAAQPQLPPRPRRVEELPRIPRRQNRPDPPAEGFDFDVDAPGGFFGEPNFESRDYNWSDYSTKVYFAVYRAWLRELLGRARRFERDQQLLGLSRLRGEVVIRHVIERDGSVTELQVLGPSQLPTLDEASAAALKRAVIPPLPSDFPRDREGVTWRFRLDVFSALQMERDLRIRQQRGQF